jgi:hypothetical protein
LFYFCLEIGTGPQGWGLDAGLTTLLCKKITDAKSKEVKTESSVAESSKEGYGSKGAVLPMITMMIIGTSFVDRAQMNRLFISGQRQSPISETV